MDRQLLNGEGIFAISDFFSPDECRRHIETSEQGGYDEAPITTARGFVMAKEIRNNDRLIVDDVQMAAEIFERARPFLPARIAGRSLVGLNERFRYYRYGPGQKFAPHYDGRFERDNGERSYLTFMIYLNDGYEGGETQFYMRQHGPEPWITVKPEQGKSLVFEHLVLHEGMPVVSGSKYVLRTDVMYAH